MSHFQQNSLIDGITSTATSSGTLTLVNTSNTTQRLTGTLGHTIVLPDATTCVLGKRFYIANRSTLAIDVQYDDLSAAASLSANTEKLFIVTDTSTSNGVWDISTGSGGGGGGGSYVQATIVNNTASPSDVTGLLFSSGTSLGTKTDYSIIRQTAGTDGTENTTFGTNIGTGFGSQLFGVGSDSNDNVYYTGGFTSFNGNTRNRLVKTDSDGTEDTAFYTNLGSAFGGATYSAYCQSDDKILVGGFFTSFNGNTRNRLVRLNSDGTEDTAFYTNLGSGFNNLVTQAIELTPGGKILLIGGFTTFNGNSRNRIALLNNDGTEDGTFFTTVGGAFTGNPTSMDMLSNGKIAIVGDFTFFNGSPVNRAIVIDTSGNVDSTFVTNIGSGFGTTTANTVSAHMAGMVIGGDFVTFNGNTRNNIVRLNNDGTEDTTFYTNSSGGPGGGAFVLKTVVFGDNQVFVLGDFTSFSGGSYNRAIGLDDDGTPTSSFNTNLGTAFNSDVDFAQLLGTGGIVCVGAFTSYNGNTRNRAMSLAGQNSEVVSQGTFRAWYSGSLATWNLAGFESVGDDVGVALTVTAGGQVQYTSTDIPGPAVQSFIRFIMTLL